MSFRGLRTLAVILAGVVMLLLVSCAPGSSGGEEEQAQRLYVGDLRKVIVLDPVSKSLVTTISVPSVGLLEWLAVRPDGRKLYASSHDSNSLVIFNTDSNTVSISLDIDIGPRGIAFNASGNTAVVARFDTFSDWGVVDVIDTGTESVSGSFHTSAWESLAGVDVHPLYDRVYAAGAGGTLYHIDLASVSGSPLVDYYPSMNVFDVEVVPTEARLYVAGGGPDLGDITTDTNGVPTGTTIYPRTSPAASDNRLRLSWNGQKLYWTNRGSVGPLDEIDRSDPATMTPIDLSPGDSADVVFSSDSSKAYVLSETDMKIYVIDTATRTVVDNFAIPGATSPKSLAYSLLP